jgi:Transposase DDE domain
MTAPLIAPLIPPGAREHGKTATARRLPVAAAPEVPEVPDGVVYGTGRIDESGRVADRAMTSMLGWQTGDRLTFTAAAGAVVARRDPAGMVTMPAKPYLVIPDRDHLPVVRLLHTRTVRLILSRDERTASGYDLALVTTDLDASPAALVTRYAARWGIEQAFADARNVLGAGEARNRVKHAVERTVPFALLAHTLIIIWYARHGHDPADIDDRRAAQPWYRTKTEPAFEDMLIKLRRTMIAARFSPSRPGQPEPEQIRAVLAA